MEDAKRNKKKKILWICVVTTLIVFIIIAIIYGLIENGRNEMINLSKAAETFLKKNIDELDEFVKICFENDINYISDHLNKDSIYKEYRIINGYYVYTSLDISKDNENILSKKIGLFKQNNITSIYCKKNDYVSLFMTKILAGTKIEYLVVKKPLEEIKDENYTDNAWYVDEHWVIIVEDYSSDLIAVFKVFMLYSLPQPACADSTLVRGSQK